MHLVTSPEKKVHTQVEKCKEWQQELSQAYKNFNKMQDYTNMSHYIAWKERERRLLNHATQTQGKRPAHCLLVAQIDAKPQAPAVHELHTIFRRASTPISARRFLSWSASPSSGLLNTSSIASPSSKVSTNTWKHDRQCDDDVFNGNGGKIGCPVRM